MQVEVEVEEMVLALLQKVKLMQMVNLSQVEQEPLDLQEEVLLLLVEKDLYNFILFIEMIIIYKKLY